MNKIYFNDKYGFTDAAINRTKTMTIEIVDVDSNSFHFIGDGSYLDKNGKFHCNFFDDEHGYLKLVKSKYGIGETVAIAQPYKDIGQLCFEDWEIDEPWFKKGLNNKMYVKADHMPYLIQITDAKWKKLQDLSDKDYVDYGMEWNHIGRSYYVNYNKNTGSRTLLNGTTSKEAFADLIDKVYGKGTWDKNPYVILYKFKTIS